MAPKRTTRMTDGEEVTGTPIVPAAEPVATPVAAPEAEVEAPAADAEVQA